MSSPAKNTNVNQNPNTQKDTSANQNTGNVAGQNDNKTANKNEPSQSRNAGGMKDEPTSCGTNKPQGGCN